MMAEEEFLSQILQQDFHFIMPEICVRQSISPGSATGRPVFPA
jgi:hypothetical protein